jgi:hypothetical protein
MLQHAGRDHARVPRRDLRVRCDLASLVCPVRARLALDAPSPPPLVLAGARWCSLVLAVARWCSLQHLRRARACRCARLALDAPSPPPLVLAGARCCSLVLAGARCSTCGQPPPPAATASNSSSCTGSARARASTGSRPALRQQEASPLGGAPIRSTRCCCGGGGPRQPRPPARLGCHAEGGECLETRAYGPAMTGASQTNTESNVPHD